MFYNEKFTYKTLHVPYSGKFSWFDDEFFIYESRNPSVDIDHDRKVNHKINTTNSPGKSNQTTKILWPQKLSTIRYHLNTLWSNCKDKKWFKMQLTFDW